MTYNWKLWAIKFIVFSAFVYATNAEKLDCGENRHWVKSFNRRAYTRSDGTKVSAAFVKAHCQDNPEGYLFWKSKMVSSKPDLWPHKMEKFTAWSVADEEVVLEALGGLPKSLWSNRIMSLHRAFEPEKLKKITPYAYEWIKNHFGDKFIIEGGKR